MASLRPTVHLRDGLLPDRLQICAWKDPDIDPESDGGITVHVLHHRFCRPRIDEEQSAAESQSPVHGAQPVFDDNKWNTPGTVHRAVSANDLEERDIFRNL